MKQPKYKYVLIEYDTYPNLTSYHESYRNSCPNYLKLPIELWTLLVNWCDTPGEEDRTLSGVIADWIDSNMDLLKWLNKAPAKLKDNRFHNICKLRDFLRHCFTRGGYAFRTTSKYRYDRKPAKPPVATAVSPITLPLEIQ